MGTGFEAAENPLIALSLCSSRFTDTVSCLGGEAEKLVSEKVLISQYWEGGGSGGRTWGRAKLSLALHLGLHHLSHHRSEAYVPLLDPELGAIPMAEPNV